MLRGKGKLSRMARWLAGWQGLVQIQGATELIHVLTRNWACSEKVSTGAPGAKGSKDTNIYLRFSIPRISLSEAP